MACHKTLKAGDTLYVNGVRIRTAYRATLSVDVDKEVLIVHATEIKHKSGDYNDMNENKM